MPDARKPQYNVQVVLHVQPLKELMSFFVMGKTEFWLQMKWGWVRP
jgi:hypothetical protein